MELVVVELMYNIHIYFEVELYKGKRHIIMRMMSLITCELDVEDVTENVNVTFALNV